MITCKLLLVARGVVRDAESGAISVFNILEGIQAFGFPMFLQQLDVVALFERVGEDPARHEVRFRASIGDETLVEIPLAIDFQDKLRNRSMVHIQGIVVPHPGVLRVIAQIGDNTLGTYDVLVELIAAPRIEAHQEPVGAGGGV
jgi:hypothetical protein